MYSSTCLFYFLWINKTVVWNSIFGFKDFQQKSLLKWTLNQIEIEQHQMAQEKPLSLQMAKRECEGKIHWKNVCIFWSIPNIYFSLISTYKKQRKCLWFVKFQSILIKNTINHYFIITSAMHSSDLERKCNGSKQTLFTFSFSRKSSQKYVKNLTANTTTDAEAALVHERQTKINNKGEIITWYVHVATP